MIHLKDLEYSYPEKLIATEPSKDFRAMLVKSSTSGSDSSSISEISKDDLLAMFSSGDVLIINTTRVVPRRVFNDDGLEILFLQKVSDLEWMVLFPARKMKDQRVNIPDENSFELIEKGLPQRIRLAKPLTSEFFARNAEMALPPYIQRARGERANRPSDQVAYQTAWAKQEGSTAAPTASLHFDLADLDKLKLKGVTICEVLLHVGLGTFLPIKSESLEDHIMHKEFCEVPNNCLETIKKAKKSGAKVWALGTTATRAIESVYAGILNKGPTCFSGDTDLFITPGFKFQVVDGLLTNFHQPGSTLLAMVSAFSSLENVKKAYSWAIEREFKLFSYGHLSIWTKS